MLRYICVALLPMVLFSSCFNRGNKAPANPIDSMVGLDIHTLSNASAIDIQHLDLNIKVDMDHRQISGSAFWTIDNKNNLKEPPARYL